MEENQEGCDKLKYGKIPEGFTYGVEYNNEEINEAINSTSPWEIGKASCRERV